MAQIETTGGGFSYTPDGKQLTKQVYVLTDGDTTVSPTVVSGATITSADFQQEPGGITRVTVTWTRGAALSSYEVSDGSGATVELIGGSREIPIETHQMFKDVSEAALREIKTAISEGRDVQLALVPDNASNSRLLYTLLLRGQEYYLGPAVSLRETVLANEMPSLKEIATINAPKNAPLVDRRQNWLMTSINARSVAQPDGSVKYEVSREWMLSDRKGWDPEGVLYSGQ